MGEYIEREAAEKALVESYSYYPNSFYNGITASASIISNLPAADVAPVRRGRWVNGRCSNCGEHAPFYAMATTYHLSNFCHRCGAKMEERE